MFAENGDSCKQKFKFDVFTHSRILSKTSAAAVDIVEFISESIFQIILSGKLGELCFSTQLLRSKNLVLTENI